MVLRRLYLGGLWGFLLCYSYIVMGQSIRTEFGKNRIQYHDDFSKWWEYETENFYVYWYGKGLNVAQSVIQIAEANYPWLQSLVEHRINDKIEIIVYVDLSDLRQSNIGAEETFETRHDRTKVIGSKIFVYFDGNHQNLERRIREGIAEVFFNSMYHPGGLQEIVTSDPDLDLPQWFKLGFFSYAGATWDYLIEDELRDLWHRNKRYHNFDHLASDHPRVAGHALWHFLSQEYGQTSITTLLYLMRLRPDLKENVEFIFGFNLKKLKTDWSHYFTQFYNRESGVFTPTDSVNRLQEGFHRYFPKSQLRLSPDGQAIVYTVNRENKTYTYLLEAGTSKPTLIFTQGHRNAVQQPDYNYPAICWHPSRYEITIAYERQDLIWIRKLDLASGEYVEQDIPENVQRVYHIDYITDDEYMMNGAINGYSELFTYRTRSRNVSAITRDFYDDLDATYTRLGGQWGILFSSNRPTPSIFNKDIDTLSTTTNFDLYFLPTGSDLALKLTNTPDINERHPRLVNGHYITYLSNYSGVNNRWVFDLNSRRPPYQQTNFNRNIINHEAVEGSDKVVFQAYNNGEYQIFLDRPNWNESLAPHFTPATIAPQALVKQEDVRIIQNQDQNIPKFLTQFDDPPNVEPLESNARYKIDNRDFFVQKIKAATNQGIEPFYSSQAVSSRRKFKLEELSLKADNSILFEGLESYTNRDLETQIQQPGYLLKGVSKDMYEDFAIQMGIRVPFNFRGSEVFAIYDDRRKRIDKRIAFYRQQKSTDFPFGNLLRRERSLATFGQYRLSYPFDTYRSVRATGTLRQDRLFFLNGDPIAAESPRLSEHRAILKLEYIYDNSLTIDLNLLTGTRYKFYTEIINRFDIQLFDGFRLRPHTGFTTAVGFDARHYIPILRHSIVAFRGAGAASVGSEKVLYFIGGTDGWLIPKFNEDSPVPANANFGFRANTPNLRGFINNTRSGQSFLLGSAELRMPIFKYLSRSELTSGFLRNIQIVGFFDTGSAWHGLLPSQVDKAFNTVTIQDSPGVTVRLDLEKSTFIYGYGVGARINFLGYFVRGDYGWGVDGGFVDKPRFYLSLGTDF